MATKPTTEELEVLQVIAATEAGEMNSFKVAEHFRGKLTATRVFNLIDSLWMKGHLWKRWPNIFMIAKQFTRTTTES